MVAGNPVITFPNTEKVERALRSLELLGVHRHLPVGHDCIRRLRAATLFEKGGLHFLTSTFEPYPFLEWRSKIVEPRGSRGRSGSLQVDLPRRRVPFLNDPLDRFARILEAVGLNFSEDLLYRFLLLGKASVG